LALLLLCLAIVLYPCVDRRCALFKVVSYSLIFEVGIDHFSLVLGDLPATGF
jgi:hypothetical protein